ncbi:alpha/beta-hydrolase [Obba rivulosa]|uniref:Alpha/beta-hydrolase n=1 Tax=Obba rivulosa TaxID=1052685 RepID=A0A8E2B0I5_9APHY|nr:alpha/beta-hydrolase [Obba rivulosa]
MTTVPHFYSSTLAFSYPGSSHPGMKALAKRYIPMTRSRDLDCGLTLVFAHCAGSHKEVWEPIIETLFSQCSPVIREAWSLEWQNHGESANMNCSVIESGRPGVSITEWEAALRYFVLLKAQEGHCLVGIGHSAGACAIVRSTMVPRCAQMPYVAIVIIEDAFGTREAWAEQGELLQNSLDLVMKAIEKRRDVWADRKDAHDSLSKRQPWKFWDKRMLDLFVRHGLRDALPFGSDQPTVTLACSKQGEKAVYADNNNEPYREASDHIASLDRSFPVHYVYGEKEDVIPHSLHQRVMASRRMASIHSLPGAGHFAIQENPNAVVSCLESILKDTAEHLPSRYKL